MEICVDVIALPSPLRLPLSLIRFDVKANAEVAFLPSPLPRVAHMEKPHCRRLVDPCRDLHLHLTLGFHYSTALTVTTEGVEAALSLTDLALHLRLHAVGEGHGGVPLAMTVRAVLLLSPQHFPCRGTRFTCVVYGVGDGLCTALHCLHEGEGHFTV